MSFAPIDRVDVLITDTEVADADRGRLAANGVEVVVA
jgi:DeoR family fructose operon transcriptional repressor